MRRLHALGALLLLAPSMAFAATKLEGEYQIMLEMQKSAYNRAFRWDWNSNEWETFNNAQLRLFSTPRAGVESFFKTEAAFRPGGENDGKRPEFKFREAHLRFRKEFSNKREWDNYLFTRQDRFYVEPYQVQIFDQRGFRLDPLLYGRGNWQGIRSEYKSQRGLNATFVVGDASGDIYPPNYTGLVPHAPLDSLNNRAGERTHDLYVLRLRREFLADSRLKLGFMLTRVEGWFGSDSLAPPLHRAAEGPGQGIYAFDSRVRLLGADVSLLYAQSYPTFASGYNGIRTPVTIGKHSTGIQLPDRAILEGEIRSIRLGTPRTGFIAVTPVWWSRGPLWHNPAGSPTGNQTGFLLQSYYLLPERAVTLTHNFGWASNDLYREIGTRYSYDEMYVEFVNGFTGKVSYRRVDNYAYNFAGLYRTPHMDLITEMQVESKLASLRVQGKVAEIGNAQLSKQIVVVEQKLNVTPKATLFNRFSFGNDADKLRKAIFTQLQYRPTGSMEMFLQYGPDYIGGGSYPVDEGSINGSGDQFDQVKFILKGNF